jgi:hypothetical protein
VLRRALLALALLAGLVLAGGYAAARSTPDLGTTGPTSVSGTEATAVFEVGDRTVRQVRYDDGGTLAYTFRVVNRGRLPLTLLGLAPGQGDPRLFSLAGLTGEGGEERVEIGGGDSAELTLRMRMGGCESLSSRSGSFVTEVRVRTSQAGLFDDEVTLTLPEQLHTGSPREAFCPSSTATSRPRG